jgi:uncharacterized membrane protein YvlD (DUF360 family)
VTDQPHLPGIQWLEAIRNEAVRTGAYTGVCLSLVFITWLCLANYVRALESVALERNLAAAAVLGLLALVPVLRFRRHPTRLFIAGILGWAVLAVAYRILCFVFQGLGRGHGLLPPPFHLFMLGAVTYGLAALLIRLAQLVLAEFHAPQSAPQHPPRDVR